jgi:hypothetical protein
MGGICSTNWKEEKRIQQLFSNWFLQNIYENFGILHVFEIICSRVSVIILNYESSVIFKSKWIQFWKRYFVMNVILERNRHKLYKCFCLF